MAAEFPLVVVQETLERLDSCQNGDYSGILLRLEYLNRTIINLNTPIEAKFRYNHRSGRNLNAPKFLVQQQVGTLPPCLPTLP